MGKFFVVVAVLGLAGCSFDSSVPLQGPAPGDAPDAGATDAEPEVACTVDDDCLPLPNCVVSAQCVGGSCDYQTKDCSVDALCTVGYCDLGDGECKISTDELDGTTCGDPLCEAVGPCNVPAQDNVCATAGTKATDCSNQVCSGGACVVSSEVFAGAPVECVLDTTGDVCGPKVCSTAGPCNYESTCSSQGTKISNCTVFECAGASCQPHQQTESEACFRGPRDGRSCTLGNGEQGECSGGVCQD